MLRKNIYAKMILVLSVVLLGTFVGIFGQAEKALKAPAVEFTYQGKLNNGTVEANGTYDFKFDIYDAETNGGIVQTVTVTGVTVTNGIFTVKLAVNPATFSGDERFLEIWATNTGTFGSPMTPRQKVTYSPYAVRAKDAETAGNAVNAGNANSLGGIAANNYVQTNDARLTDARTPTAGSGEYIQNGTTDQVANFNVYGKGTALQFNVRDEYQISGQRVFASSQYTGSLSVGTNSGQILNALLNQNNSFFGIASGSSISTGNSNTFVGRSSGEANDSPSYNTFVGTESGKSHSFGNNNSFFGYQSGFSNIQGAENTFLGSLTGFSTTYGDENTFVGSSAGSVNTTGYYNSIFGAKAGISTVGGFGNSFFGHQSGYQNTGNRNAFFGDNTGMGNTSGSNNTFIGSNAKPAFGDLTYATAIGAGSIVGRSNTIVLGRNQTDAVAIGKLEQIASTSLPVCMSASGILTYCSSSIRYKNNIQDFRPSLDLIKRLRPVTFNWKGDNKADMGLVAEEVNAVEPLLTTTNKDGEVEGVKYDRVGVVLVNAVNEQQDQIEAQQKQLDEQKVLIEKQQKELDALKKLICAGNEKAAVCRPKEQK